MTYTNGTVTYNPTDPADTSQQGTIKFTDTFMDCDPHTFTFMQNALPTAGFGASEGLRLQFELMITNQTGKPWNGFWVKLQNDNVPEGTADSEDHKAHSHFHPNRMANPTPPPAQIGTQMVTGDTGFTAPSDNDINNQTMFLIGGGRHENGKTFNMNNFFLHERNGRNAAGEAVPRMFDLVLMPHCVPEPSSFVLMMTGLFGVAGRWRRCATERHRIALV